MYNVAALYTSPQALAYFQKKKDKLKACTCMSHLYVSVIVIHRKSANLKIHV